MAVPYNYIKKPLAFLIIYAIFILKYYVYKDNTTMKEQVNWLIVGLGNPGREYEKTRHNAGWRAIDRIAEKLKVKIDKLKFQGLYAQVNYGDGKLFLLKPQTYMNLSGRSVLQLSAFFKVPPARIIVLFDDISLEPGKLRLRKDGSAGGHNGIKSIIQELGSQDFPRVKIGVGGKAHPDQDLATHVLSGFSASEEKDLTSALERAADAALCIVTDGVPETANRFNGSKP